MKHTARLSMFALLAALLMAGCPSSPSPVPTPSVAVQAPLNVTLAGLVKVPARFIGHDAGNGSTFIGHDAGNGSSFIGHDAGNGSVWHLLAVDDVLVGGASVRLLDASGAPVLGVASATTDAQGRYAFSAVPAGTLYQVAVDLADGAGHPTTFKTLARPAAGAASADVSTASTFAASYVLASAPQPAGIDTALFGHSVELLAAKLVDADLASLPDPATQVSAVQHLAAADTALNQALDQVEHQLVPSPSAPSPCAVSPATLGGKQAQDLSLPGYPLTLPADVAATIAAGATLEVDFVPVGSAGSYVVLSFALAGQVSKLHGTAGASYQVFYRPNPNLAVSAGTLTLPAGPPGGTLTLPEPPAACATGDWSSLKP